MRKWFVSLSLACGCSIALANAASAQVEIQIQAQPAQVQKVQIQVQAQAVQAQPIQIQLAALPPEQAQVLRVAMPGIGMPGNNRLAQSDAVFVGRVIAIEPMDVEATTVPNGAKAKYRVAIVQVTESIGGLKKDTKMVRVGFLAQGNNVLPGVGGGIQIQPAIQPINGRRPFPGNFQQQVNLQIGQDGLFNVNKHHKEDFYLSPLTQNFVTRENNPNFETQLKTAKQLSKVMADLVGALKGADKQDRYTAAAFLITKYRTQTGQPMKLEPIDAAESKLILKALAEGEWKVGVFNAAIPAPQELFNQLGISQKDGYDPSKFRNQEEFLAGMQKWLDENNGKYRIQKLVVDPNAKLLPGVGINPNPGFEPGIRGLPIRVQPGQIQVLPAPVQDLPAQPAPKQDK